MDFSLVRKMVGLERHGFKKPVSNVGLENGCYLHLGCGDRILDDFVNIDFLPNHENVIGWNLLDSWPENLVGKAGGIFSEDVFEHFFYEEQMCLLCESNICLQAGAINRILMPSFDRVISSINHDAAGGHYWRRLYAAETPVDIANAMLRHSGHRWLHNSESLKLLAEKCGYSCEITSCRQSADPRLSDINLRDESNSLSFSADLKKIRELGRCTLSPSKILNATLLEKDERGAFYRSTSDDPIVIYENSDLSAAQIVLINARVFNVVPGFEHNIVKFYFGDSEEFSFFNDRSLISVPYNNFVQGNIVRRLTGEKRKIGALRVDPVDTKDSIFYVGNLDVYFNQLI